jgi:receptor-type tyrosine-protein phosphatase gamma
MLNYCVIYIYRKGEKTDWESAQKIATQFNDTHYVVRHLRPYTIYSFQVSAVNGVGISKPSKSSFYLVTHREGEQMFYDLFRKFFYK